MGWVYEYALVTGKYCASHPDGAWHDPTSDKWYASPAQAPAEARPRLVHHRIFQDARVVSCPLDGKPLVDSKLNLADLRSQQDWYLRYALTAVDGVSEVAPIGGFVKQYQVVVDPVKLLGLNVPLGKVKTAIQRSNIDVGGRLMEMSETEYMLRGVGYLGSLTDREIAEAREAGKTLAEIRNDKVLAELRLVALGANAQGKPIYLSDVAEVRTGPDIRRGVAEWNGRGETVGGIVVMRFGENARQTIANVRAKLADLERGLPPGVAIETAYDRCDLIERAVHTLSHTLIEEITVVSLVILLFLLHARSALVAVFVAAHRRARQPGGHEPARHQRQHHEPGRHRHRHRRDGRQRHHHGGERAQAPGPGGPCASPRALRRARAWTSSSRRPSESGPDALLRPAHHHGQLPAHLRARRTIRAALQAAGLHQDLRHGLRRAVWR